MYFGSARWQYDGPTHCVHTEDSGPLDGFRHDVGCWGWRTALWNLWYRVCHWDRIEWEAD